MYKILKTDNSPAILIRIIVGSVFFSEGIQKFIFPDALGVGRFIKIGIPVPHFFAPFVGVVEIVFGLLIMAGLLTRLSAIPLIIDITVAILTTKIPMLINEGFWKTIHESRVDYSMLLGLIFLLIVGAGKYSVDRKIYEKKGLGN
jgi:putative oxidoreductase